MSRFIHTTETVESMQEINPAIKLKEDEGWEFVPPITHIPEIYEKSESSVVLTKGWFVLTFMKEDA